MPEVDCVALFANNTLPADILSAINAFAAVSLIPPIFIFIKISMEKKLKTSSKILFHLGLTLFLLIFAHYAFHTIWYITMCRNYNLSLVFRYINVYVYMLQGVLLVLLLFFRLYLIFKDSKFALTKCSIITFLITLIVASILSSIGFALEYLGMISIADTLQSIGGGVYIVTVMALNGMFIYKMYRVQRAAGDKNSAKFLNIITKTCLLYTISAISIMVTLSVYFLRDSFNSVGISFLSEFLFVVDLHTNFVSILLSYGYCDKWYTLICGCLHRKCHQCLSAVASNKPALELETSTADGNNGESVIIDEMMDIDK